MGCSSVLENSSRTVGRVRGPMQGVWSLGTSGSFQMSDMIPLREESRARGLHPESLEANVPSTAAHDSGAMG